MSSQKNGASTTGDDMLAKALKEIRRKTQTDGAKKPSETANGGDQVIVLFSYICFRWYLTSINFELLGHRI